MVLILLVIVISLINLTLGYPHQELWISLLSSSIGYILPGPKLSKSKKFLSVSLGDYHSSVGGGERASGGGGGGSGEEDDLGGQSGERG